MENEQTEISSLFGLVGRNIDYSFSRGYFTDKFKKEHLSGYKYVNFDIQNIDEIRDILEREPLIKGLNVTIPYKEAIIPYLQSLDETAQRIGAVNTIKVNPEGLAGYNTDYYGFKVTIEKHLRPHHKKALILGTGGASKAVAYALDILGLEYRIVSRTSGIGRISYDQLSEDLIKDHTVIVNCTPLGTFPDIEKKPDLPYNYLTAGHLLYDLIYNPEITAFLKEGLKKGTAVCNGSEMLKFQAEEAWEIWNR